MVFWNIDISVLTVLCVPSLQDMSDKEESDSQKFLPNQQSSPHSPPHPNFWTATVTQQNTMML